MKKFVLECLTTDDQVVPVKVNADAYELAAEKASEYKGIKAVKGIKKPRKKRKESFDFKDNMVRNAYPHIKNNNGKFIRIYS